MLSFPCGFRTADDWPASLFGVQPQRVALARALVSHASQLALDELLGALDALTRLTMQVLILLKQQTVGFPAILVTHDVVEAVASSDRVMVLDHGKVAADVSVDIPHLRPRASANAVEIEAQALDPIFV